jgi:hypothetical protein
MIDVSDVPHLRNALTVISYFVETVKGKKFSAKEFINRPQVRYCKTAREAVALEEKNWCEPIMTYWKTVLEAVTPIAAAPVTEVVLTPLPVPEIILPTPAQVAMPPPVPMAPEVKKGKK